MNRKLLSVGLLAALATTSAFTQADEPMEDRERIAIARMSVANAANEKDGRYRQARTLVVDGSTSVSSRTNAWFAKMQGWIEGWAKILAFSDLNNDISFESFQSELANMLAAQSRVLQELQTEAASIQQAGTNAVALLNTREKIPTGPETQNYNNIISALETRQGELQQMVGAVNKLLTQKAERLAEVDDVSRRAIIAHMKAALLARARYPLQKALADVNALLAAEKIVDPALTRLDDMYGKMNAYTGGFAYSHAAKTITPARTDCTDVRATLGTLIGPASFVNGAKTRADKLCSGIESMYSSMTNRKLARSTYLSMYLRVQKPKFKSACATSKDASACEKLAIVASIPAMEISKMSDAELEFVELEWGANLERAQTAGGK